MEGILLILIKDSHKYQIQTSHIMSVLGMCNIFNPLYIHEKSNEDYYLINMVRQEKEIKLFGLKKKK